LCLLDADPTLEILRGLEAADQINGRSTSPMPEPAPPARPKTGARDKKRPKDAKDRAESPFEIEEESKTPRIIEDIAEDEVDSDVHIVNVSEGKVKTKKMKKAVKSEPVAEVEELDTDFEEHGVLVRKILEMKRGIEAMERQKEKSGANEASGDEKLDDLEQQQKEREAIRFRQDVAALRRKIQTLSACVGPMGRDMDEVQIAVDVMLQEYMKWRDENALLSQRLIQERSESEACLAPLLMKLRVLQTEIDDKTEHIRSQKRVVEQNDERIQRILVKGLQMGKDGDL